MKNRNSQKSKNRNSNFNINISKFTKLILLNYLSLSCLALEPSMSVPWPKQGVCAPSMSVPPLPLLDSHVHRPCRCLGGLGGGWAPVNRPCRFLGAPIPQGRDTVSEATNLRGFRGRKSNLTECIHITHTYTKK